MKLNLLLDSGAYSCWSQGKAIDVQKYCDFIITNNNHINTSVNLDVISPGNPEIAAAEGHANYLAMKDRGVNPMPVFHAREGFSWLEKMLNDTDYIGISGTSLVSPKENKIWHDLVFTYLTDSNGYPIAKFHAFGDTSERSLTTYPFYSADSATWMIQAGRAARVKLQGKAYQLRSHSITDNNYISNTDTGLKREAWEKEFRILGLDPERVMNVEAKGAQLAMIRSFLVAADMLRLQRDSVKASAYKKSQCLINLKRNLTGGVERVDPVKLFFVISPSAYYFNFPIIATLGITNVLLSYYYIITAPEMFWHERFLPFLYDPIGFCQSDPKVKKYWDKLHECVLPQIVAAS